MSNSQGKYAMNSRLYDFLKDLTLIYLPAFGTLYFTIAQIWGLPNAEEIVGTIVAVATFLGVCLKISKTSYDNSDRSKDGDVVVNSEGLKRIELDATAEDVIGKKRVVLAVKEEPDLPLEL